MGLARETDSILSDWRDRALRFEAEIGKVVLGQERVIRLLTIATFARGHVLLEGDVGVGKTTILRALAQAIGGAFERIEGTIDLMPADLIYHAHLGEDGKPRIDPGPLLKQGEALSVFFFNEINRARPQVHSLLLRLMAERSVSAFNREYRFPHVQVFADRNRVEREETFELPAAARDRFLMEVQVMTPDDREARRSLVFNQRFHNVDTLLMDVEPGVLDPQALETVARIIQIGVHASPTLEAYVLALWDAVSDPQKHGVVVEGVDMRRLVQGGASPRGLSYLVRAARVRSWLEGRDMIVPEDVRTVFPEVMAHRIFVDPVYELRRERVVAELIAGIFAQVPAP